MQTTSKLPVGIQTFAHIREEGYLYVDKTNFVYNLANSYKYVFLSRPRRFGKSLLLSTFEEYFKGNKELFKGLALERLETEWKSYPVLRFDLSGEAYLSIRHLVANVSGDLSVYEKQYGISPEFSDDDMLGSRLQSLLRNIHEKTGKKIVVLIDEYDKPMLDSFHDDTLHNNMKLQMRGFYSVLKKCDALIQFAMLTGVTKFGKVSIFSGLNNLEDISMMNEFNEICGISEQEFHRDFRGCVSTFAEFNDITEEETWQEFKKFYDGYHFSKKGSDIYNPFSTLSAFKKNELGSYWFATGSSDYLTRLISRHRFILKELEGERRTEIQLSDITDRTRDLVPLLYQAGYLTIKGYDSRFRLYTLGFPNLEVNHGFWTSLADYFFYDSRRGSVFDLQSFVLDLESGRIEDFITRMRSLFASLSSEHEPDKEVHFQNIITIFTKMLGFEVDTEVHSSQGRSDIEINTSNYIYIIELKVDSSSEEALNQIMEKGYARQYEADSRTKLLVGVNFSSKTRTLSPPAIEVIS